MMRLAIILWIIKPLSSCSYQNFAINSSNQHDDKIFETYDIGMVRYV